MIKLDAADRFDNIEDRELRNANRGAIMANIFEEYSRAVKTHSYSYRDFLSQIDTYTIDFSKKEYVEAKDAMIKHLLKRGYRYGG